MREQQVQERFNRFREWHLRKVEAARTARMKQRRRRGGKEVKAGEAVDCTSAVDCLAATVNCDGQLAVTGAHAQYDCDGAVVKVEGGGRSARELAEL